MLVFLVVISVAFLFVSHNLYHVFFEPYISNFYLNIIAYIFTLLIGQSFYFLTTDKFNKNLDYIIYIIVFTFCVLFFYYIIINIVRLFILYNNPQTLDLYVLIFIIVLGIFGFFNRYFIKTTRYTIPNSSLNMKIALITDIHIGDVGINEKILNKVVNIINKEKIDIIILGGDIIEQKANAFTENYSSYFKKMKSKYGIFGVLGNHEYYGGQPYLITQTLKEKANINILNDSLLEFDNFILIGREDKAKSFITTARKDIPEIINLQTTKYKILIDHNPKFFNESVHEKINLQLSGHTHNGQFFPFNFVVKFFYEKSYGLLKKENSILITSSGLSTWRIPIKLFSKPEVVIINLTLLENIL